MLGPKAGARPGPDVYLLSRLELWCRSGTRLHAVVSFLIARAGHTGLAHIEYA